MSNISIKSGKSTSINVTTTPKNRISINTGGGVGAAGVNRLTQLYDVDATNRSNNDTIVYDAVSDKFVVEELPIINGGEF